MLILVNVIVCLYSCLFVYDVDDLCVIECDVCVVVVVGVNGVVFGVFDLCGDVDFGVLVWIVVVVDGCVFMFYCVFDVVCDLNVVFDVLLCVLVVMFVLMLGGYLLVFDVVVMIMWFVW